MLIEKPRAHSGIFSCLSQVRLRKGLPFDVKIPNKTTLKAMMDAEGGRNLTECEDAGYVQKAGL